jgi:cell wall-associated NlpC family hydrolase
VLTHALNTPAPAVEDHPVAVRRPTLARIFALLTVVVAVASLGACTTSNSKTKGAQIVSNARAQIGDPYVFGAAGPNSFDCSGLVQYAHRLAGINIGRTSQAQAAGGRSIAKSAALPGDVVAIGPARTPSSATGSSTSLH